MSSILLCATSSAEEQSGDVMKRQPQDKKRQFRIEQDNI